MHADHIAMFSFVLLCFASGALARWDIKQSREKQFCITSLKPVWMPAIGFSLLLSCIVAVRVGDRIASSDFAKQSVDQANFDADRNETTVKTLLRQNLSKLAEVQRAAEDDLAREREANQHLKLSNLDQQRKLREENDRLTERKRAALAELGTFPNVQPLEESNESKRAMQKFKSAKTGPQIHVARKKLHDLCEMQDPHACTHFALTSTSTMSDESNRLWLFEGCLLGDVEACDDLYHWYYYTDQNTRPRLSYAVRALRYRSPESDAAALPATE